MEIMTKNFKKHGGQLRQFIVDDKGKIWFYSHFFNVVVSLCRCVGDQSQRSSSLVYQL